MALSGPAIAGIVTDKATGEPVAGAQVVVSWDGTHVAGGFSEGGCYYVQIAITDRNGRFSVPAWSKFVLNTVLFDYKIGVYSPGYDVVEGEDSGGLVARDGRPPGSPNKLTLPILSGTVKQRLDRLSRMRKYVGCAEAGASRRNFLDFYKAMNIEIKQLLATPEGQALQQQEHAELVRRGKLGMDTVGFPTLAVDLDSGISSILQSHDNELYEPVRRPETQK
jgi:hypothetical protein